MSGILSMLGTPTPRTVPIIGYVTGDDWGPPFPFELWGGTKITVNVSANSVLMRLARSRPPEPPEWDYPIPLGLGQQGHVGPFGYVQFKSANKGAPGVITGALYSE